MNPMYSIDLANGQAWSAIVQKGKLIKITSLNETPNVSALLYNADLFLDRYNMPDTLKGQHISKLSAGSGLHSDMGRLMASIVESSIVWHDPVCGLGTSKSVEERFGKKTFAEVRNEYYRNGFDNMLTELGKYGLGLKDLVPNINLFSKVVVNEDGSLQYCTSNAAKGDSVSIRMDMKCLVVLSNTPHPLYPKGQYPGGPVKIEISSADPVIPETDICLQSRPENFRAWENTRDYYNLSE